jgi:rhodanese-related sulfurtransferase
MINSGKVMVFRKGAEGVKTELGELGPGESFGEMALLTGEPRSGYVEALEETHLTVISKDEFDRILKDYPLVSRQLVEQLSAWILTGDLKLEREVERRFRVPGLSWVDLIIILGLSLLFGIFFNLSNPSGVKLIPESWSEEALPIVAPSEAVAKYVEGTSLFVDARPPNFFKQEHIRGAINLPLALFDIMYMMGLSQLSRDKEIVIYGRTISRLYDEQVARKLILRGHKNTKMLHGGLSKWKTSGYPVGP